MVTPKSHGEVPKVPSRAGCNARTAHEHRAGINEGDQLVRGNKASTQHAF